MMRDQPSYERQLCTPYFFKRERIVSGINIRENVNNKSKLTLYYNFETRKNIIATYDYK